VLVGLGGDFVTIKYKESFGFDESNPYNLGLPCLPYVILLHCGEMISNAHTKTISWGDSPLQPERATCLRYSIVIVVGRSPLPHFAIHDVAPTPIKIGRTQFAPTKGQDI